MDQTIDVSTIDRQVDLVVADSGTLAIHDDASLELAGALLLQIKTIIKNIERKFGDPIKSAHEAHTKILALKKECADPLLKAERVAKSAIATYQTEQRRIREAEERRLREQAQKEEEERRLAQAQELESAGETQAAEELISQPVVAPPVVLPRTPKAAGVSTRTSWKWRLIDIKQVPAAYLTTDDKKINGVVRSMGKETSIPGIEVYPIDVVSARTG